MGAYENPQAVIDTGTPQILANAIGSFGKQVASVLDQEKQRKAAEEKRKKDWLDYTFKFSMNEYDKVNQQMIANGVSTSKGFELLTPLIDNSTSLKLKAAQAGSMEEQKKYLKQAQEDQQKVTNYISLAKGLKEADADYTKLFAENPGKAGKGGGIPMVGEQDSKYNLAMAIRGGYNKGTQEQFYDEASKEWKIKFTSDAIKKDGRFGDSIVWSQNELAGYDLGTLTDIDTKQFKLLEARNENNILGTGILAKDGELSESFYDPTKKEVKQVTENGVTIQTIIHPANKAAIENALRPKLRAEAIGILSNPSQAQKDWENILGLGSNLKDLKYGAGQGDNNTVFEQESFEAFINAYEAKGLEKVKNIIEKGRQAGPSTIIEKPEKKDDPTKEDVKLASIQKNVDDAYEALYVSKIFEGNIKDKTGKTAKLSGQTIKSLGESGFAEQLQKIGLKIKKTEVAGEGDEKITRYTIESSKIPAFGEQIRSDETLNEVVTKLFNATGVQYPGIVDPATKDKFNKLN